MNLNYFKSCPIYCCKYAGVIGKIYVRDWKKQKSERLKDKRGRGLELIINEAGRVDGGLVSNLLDCAYLK